jgi:hypothetical protein
MTKAILIFLLMELPWQAIAAAERNFTHVLGSGKSNDPGFVVMMMQMKMTTMSRMSMIP